MKSILKILKDDQVISLREAVKILGNDKAVYKLVETNTIMKLDPIGLGLFCLPSADEGTAQLAAVNKYYPDCIISGPTALSLYGMSLDYIDKIDVDIDNKKNLANEMLRVHRVISSKINNIEHRSFKEKGIEFKLKIYSPERVLHEAHKYYSGLDSFYRAIKVYKEKYLKTEIQGDQFNTILKINKKIGKELINLLQMSEAS